MEDEFEAGGAVILMGNVKAGDIRRAVDLLLWVVTLLLAGVRVLAGAGAGVAAGARL